MTIDTTKFRQVLGQYPTGVVVVTAYDSTGEVTGMTLGSFTSVSLEPALVAFLPSVTSSSWRTLRETGSSYAINILGNDQESVCRAVAMKKTHKFAGIETYPSPHGNPVIAGSVAYIDCTATQIHDAGDHHIVVCEVHNLEPLDGSDPLLFFRGGYGSFAPQTLTAWGPDLLNRLTRVDVVRPVMEELAATFNTEITVSSLVGDQIVVLASAGRPKTNSVPTRLGARFPFVPPIGALEAAWDHGELRERWIASAPSATAAERSDLRGTLDRIEGQGFSVNTGHAVHERLLRLSIEAASAPAEVTIDELAKACHAEQSNFDVPPFSVGERVEFRGAGAPIFDATGRVALTLLLWGPSGEISWTDVMTRVEALVRAARSATSALQSAEG
jgi:flavin reductase (DIM6/NTAB) family NADH-FMN oxidoreductase RutF/DNA-binding IclR family transcriptional regulator